MASQEEDYIASELKKMMPDFENLNWDSRYQACLKAYTALPGDCMN